jgi:ribosomal-protein-alanine N-acetyltransferase
MIVEANPNPALLRFLLVAEDVREDRLNVLVGFAVAKVVGTGAQAIAELESIVVAKQTQRSGVGRALCTAIIQWCRELKISNVELEVRSSNSGAIALYTNIGFAPTGFRKGYYHDPKEDAILMKMDVLR